MTSNLELPPSLEFKPVTTERWGDMDDLLGEHGAADGCWCMWWRVTRAQFQEQRGEGNRQAMKAIVESGEVPGILAYSAGEPIAWCSIAPREKFPTLNRSRPLRRVDNQPVWSITCFYLLNSFRGKGLSLPLLDAAIDHARSNGGKIVEGYPVELQKVLAGGSGYMGIVPAFQQVGFQEVARRSPDQPIMRRFI